MRFSQAFLARYRSIKTKPTLFFLTLLLVMSRQPIHAQEKIILGSLPNPDTPNIVMTHAVVKQAYKPLVHFIIYTKEI